MKKYLVALILLGLCPFARADSKVSALTQDTTAQATDLLYKVDSPAGTPVSRSISVSDLFRVSGVSVYPATSTILANAGMNVSTLTVTSGSVTFSGASGYPRSKIYFSAAAGLCAATNGCSDPAQYATATSSVNYIAATFGAGTTQYWQTSFTLPKNYVDGSTFTASVEFTSTATTTNTTWNVDSMALHNGTVLDTSWGTAVQVSSVSVSANTLVRTVESGGITPGNSPVNGDRLFIRVYRGDSSGDARFMGIWLSYFFNALTEN